MAGPLLVLTNFFLVQYVDGMHNVNDAVYITTGIIPNSWPRIFSTSLFAENK